MIVAFKSDIPVPLATKIYYSQRNNRLRSAVTHLYHVTSANELCSNAVGPEVSQESIMQLQASSQRGSSSGQANDLLNKKVCTYYFLSLVAALPVGLC